jgi:Zn-dependent hydrolases, including glyoxylases
LLGLQNTWFKVTEVANKTWLINDNGFDNIYLVEGKEKALLIDTGCGVGDLKQLLSTLTSLPIIVVNTHGHPDHVMGNAQFKDIHMDNQDALLLKEYISYDNKKMILENMLQGQYNSEFSTEKWLNAKMNNIIPIKNGHKFDLGDRDIIVISLPGHSAGCIGLLDERERLFFSGDSIIECDMWLHLNDSLPLSTFLQSIKNVSAVSEKFSKILSGHNMSPIQTEIIDEIIQGVTKIVEGELIGSLHHTFMGDGLLCRFSRCGVVYNPDNL